MFPHTFQRCFKCSQFLGILASMASSALGIVTLLLVYVVAAAVVIASIEARGRGGGGQGVAGRQSFTPRRDLEGMWHRIKTSTFKSWPRDQQDVFLCS